MTDPELVERARDGDSSALAELVGRHHHAALRAAMAALGSASGADDAVQEAWMIVRAKLGDFHGESSFRTWLLAIVWRQAIDQRRSVLRWLQRQVSFDEASPAGVGDRSALAGHSPAVSPEAALLNGELQRTLARLIRALPSKLRDPLLLVGSGEYTYDEVAAMLHQPVGTVKWRVSEARRQIRVKLTRLGLRPPA